MRTIKITILLMLAATVAAAQDASSLYNEGLELKKQDSKAACDKFKQAVQLKPDYTEAIYEMGWCQNDQKQYRDALSSFRKIIKVWASIPKLNFETGYAFEKLEQTDSAIYYYNNCLQLKSDYSLAYKQLGMIAYSKNESEDKILDYFSKYEASAKAPITDYLYWYRKGFTQNAKKDYEGARISLKKSLESKTDYTNTYLELGFASSKLKQNDDAIAYYKKAIEMDPKSHIGYNGIGEVYRDNIKDMDEAMNWYNKALAINSNERKANFGMGYCLNSKAKYYDAITYLKKSIAMEPTYTAAYVEIGYSYYRTNDAEQGESNLKKALQLNNKNENARYYLGLIYISQGKKSMAQQMVDELKQLNSKNAAGLQDKVTAMN
ncbi:tetratricopeptide repeat protein [Ferruginibacter sp.]